MLEEAQTESESHQTALGDCQDMLEELQTFSQGQQARLQQLQEQLQVAACKHHRIMSTCMLVKQCLHASVGHDQQSIRTC